MSSLIRKALAGAALIGATVFAQESQVKPAVDPSRNSAKQVAVQSENGVFDAAWYNISASNVYTTAWGVPFNLTPVINTDLGAVVNGISADVYANYVPKNGKVNDLEFTLAGTPVKSENFSVDLNAGYWIFPDTGYSNAKVLKVKIAPSNLPLRLNASVSAQKLWAKETRGVLYEADVNRSFTVKGATLTAGVQAAYNDRQYSGQSGFAALNPYASINFPVSKSADITLSYKSQNPQSDFRPEGADNRNVFSVKLNFNLKKFGKK